MFKKALRLYSPHNKNVLLGVLRESIEITSAPAQYNCRRFNSTNPLKWDLYSAICVERHPIISCPMNDLEKRFFEMLQRVEFANSMKCDHELKLESEENMMSLPKEIKNSKKLSGSKEQFTKDFMDQWETELKNFKFAPTTTIFDEQNITTSLERKLDKNLVLIIQQKIGNSEFWIPPQGIRKDGETMRQTAERVLNDHCGETLKVQFYGNAPIGFYKYRYPKELREKGTYGAKVFFYLAKYKDGDFAENKKCQWLDYTELKDVLPSRVYKSVSLFLKCD